MVLCLEIRKMSLTIWKDVPSLTIFSDTMFIFINGQLQILASALQEMRISSFRTKSQRSRNGNRNYCQLILARTMPVTSSRAFKIEVYLRLNISMRANNVSQYHIDSLVASPMCPIGNPEMLSTSNFYDGNVIYVVWKDKLA